MADDFVAALESMEIDIMRGIARKYQNSKPNVNSNALKKQLKEWAKQPTKLHRKYHWYNVSQLKTRIKEIDTGVHIPTKKVDVLSKLVDLETRQIERDNARDRGEVCGVMLICLFYFVLPLYLFFLLLVVPI